MALGLQPGYLLCGADGKDMSWKLERVQLPGDAGSSMLSV